MLPLLSYLRIFKKTNDLATWSFWDFLDDYGRENSVERSGKRGNCKDYDVVSRTYVCMYVAIYMYARSSVPISELIEKFWSNVRINEVCWLCV